MRFTHGAKLRLISSREDSALVPISANMALRCAVISAASASVAARVVSIIAQYKGLFHAPNSRHGRSKTYHPLVRPKLSLSLSIDRSLLKPGMRLAVGLSGGADSVALLRALAAESRELGLVLHAAHLHHGLRGVEADSDLAFARKLANNSACRSMRPASTPPEKASPIIRGKKTETIEEAARRLRYGWFRKLMAAGRSGCYRHGAHSRRPGRNRARQIPARGVDRGLFGHSSDARFPEGRILRPLLGRARAEIEEYLRALNQSWREDSTNRQLNFTRNRIRHELLPLLEGWNPRLREHLAQMAELARDEEEWWQAEIARVAPQVFAHGRPVRGGGRAASEDLALDIGVSRHCLWRCSGG